MSRVSAGAAGRTHGRAHDLIESDKVVGTNVYRAGGEKIGKIERLMIDRYGGQVGYAVMSFGGFLGMGHEHYPIPWMRLDNKPELGGFEVDISDEELKNAPKFDPGDEWDWADADKGRDVYSYYRVPPYWL